MCEETESKCAFVCQIATTENEIAKTMLETEQVRSQINSLEKKKSELEAEMRAKDDIVAKSQAEIKRRNVEIKRNQDNLQQLSSDLDKLVTMAGGAELGPLEIQINSLQKSIEAENATIAELQHTWVRDQGELVSLPAASVFVSVIVLSSRPSLSENSHVTDGASNCWWG